MHFEMIQAFHENVILPNKPDYMQQPEVDYVFAPESIHKFKIRFDFFHRVEGTYMMHRFESEDSMEEALDRMQSWLFKQPKDLEAKKIKARKTLGLAVEACQEAEVSMPFINELQEKAKELATDILTYQKDHDVDWDKEAVKADQTIRNPTDDDEIPF